MKKTIAALGMIVLLAFAGYYLWPGNRHSALPGPAEAAAPDTAAPADLSSQAEIDRTELRIQQLLLRQAEMDSTEFQQALAAEKELLRNLKREVQDQRAKLNALPPPEKKAEAAPATAPSGNEPAPPAFPPDIVRLVIRDRGFALIFGVIALLILLVIFLLIRIIRRSRRMEEEPAAEELPVPPPGPAPEAPPAPDVISMIKAGTGSQDLKKAMETYQPPDQTSNLIETVYFYADQGLSEKEIAEKLRLDVDRVRLIIKFKR